jgi:metallophosphoesterase superfamily enzyme
MKNLKDLVKESRKQNTIKAIKDALDASGLDISDVGSISKIAVTGRSVHDEDKGTEKQTTTYQVVLSPAFQGGPGSVIERAEIQRQIKRQKSKTKRTHLKGWETAVILPDIQIGYYDKSIDPTRVELEPIHDETAISVALQVISDIQPDQIVMNGDNLDFAEFSKYLNRIPFRNMVQPAIDRAAELCKELREAAPEAKIVWIEGNHESRLHKYMDTFASAASGVTRGKLKTQNREDFPVNSVPFLCRMADFDVEYLVGYPESRYFLNSNLSIIHGHKVNSNGTTAAKYLNDAHQSVIYGHVHRMEYMYRTRRSPKGPRTVMAASPGCLCRTDGAVPSTNSGSDYFGRPLSIGGENWQQGLAIVQYQPFNEGDEWFNYEPMWIFNGRGILRGVEYLAT